MITQMTLLEIFISTKLMEVKSNGFNLQMESPTTTAGMTTVNHTLSVTKTSSWKNIGIIMMEAIGLTTNGTHAMMNTPTITISATEMLISIKLK